MMEKTGADFHCRAFAYATALTFAMDNIPLGSERVIEMVRKVYYCITGLEDRRRALDG